MTNILITSISSKVPLINAVLDAKNKFDKSIKVFGADIKSEIIGKYFVDELYIMPRISDLNINDFIEYCLEKRIKYIIPTRDEDVLFYSFFKEKFLKNKIHIFSPEHQVVQKCFDKYIFVKENGINYNIKTSLLIDNLKGVRNFVVKDRFGSGSKNLGLNLNYEEALNFSKNIENPLFQEFIEGEEYSVDSYVSTKNEFIGLIIRKREIIANGEAVVTCSVEDKFLEKNIVDFLLKNKIIGHSVTQVIKKDNDYFLIECNTRFGGASTLSYKMGLESFYWFLCEVNGVSFNFKKDKKNFRQIRIAKDIYFEC